MTEEIVLNPVEEQALAKGWKPEEDFKTDPKNEGKTWRSAEDFMDRQSFFDKIDEQHKQIKDLQRGLKAQSEYNARIEKLSYDKAITDLKAERKSARADGDEDRVDELEEKIEKLKEQKAQVKEIPVAPSTDTPPAVQTWKKENPWYETDQEMREFADFTASQLSTRGVFGDELLQRVTEKVKSTFALKFRNPNKDKAQTMEKGTSGVKKTEGETLSSEEEQLISRMIKAGVPHPTEKRNMTAAEYRSQLLKLKGA